MAGSTGWWENGYNSQVLCFSPWSQVKPCPCSHREWLPNGPQAHKEQRPSPYCVKPNLDSQTGHDILGLESCPDKGGWGGWRFFALMRGADAFHHLWFHLALRQCTVWLRCWRGSRYMRHWSMNGPLTFVIYPVLFPALTFDISLLMNQSRESNIMADTSFAGADGWVWREKSRNYLLTCIVS